VRCGHCHDVFNALEGLFDLERRDSALQGLRTEPSPLDTPVPEAFPDSEERVGSLAATPSAFLPDLTELQSAAPASGAPMVAAARAPSMDHWPSLPEPPASAEDEASSPAPGDADDFPRIVDSLDEDIASVIAPAEEAAATPKTSAARISTAQVAAVEEDDELEDDPFPVTALSDDLDDHDPFEASIETVSLAETLTDLPEAPPMAAPQANDEPVVDELPTFVREAQRRDWWSRPVVQVLVGTGAALSVLALGAQVAWHHRDLLAASCSACTAPLTAVADWAEQPLRPPVDLDAVEVDNATLTQPPGSDGYRLTVQVRNHAPHAVAAPHMELSLTDAAGALVIRRNFSPTDFGHAQALVAQEESIWVLEFQTPQRKVSGYTVAAFYP
jgi:hypothetical protein